MLSQKDRQEIIDMVNASGNREKIHRDSEKFMRDVLKEPNSGVDADVRREMLKCVVHSNNIQAFLDLAKSK